MTDRLLGYKTQPFCGKGCCHEASRKNRTALKRSLRRRERNEWKKEVRFALAG